LSRTRLFQIATLVCRTHRQIPNAMEDEQARRLL
jgi:hypothetical protein